MSSERRTQSSRANGAKSQGPVTPEGKARASQNSVRHGLLSGSLVLEQEHKPAFTELLTSFEQTIRPKDDFELHLVVTMAAARWRCLRIWGMETAGLDRAIANITEEDLTPATRASLAFQSLCDGSNSADLLGRYETRYDRQFSRACNLLWQYRKNGGPTVPELPPSTFIDYKDQPSAPPASAPSTESQDQPVATVAEIQDCQTNPVPKNGHLARQSGYFERRSSSKRSTCHFGRFGGQALGLRRPPRPPLVS